MVENGGFAATLRTATAEVHADAERSGFVEALTGGTLGRQAYAGLAGQLLHVYTALEDVGDRLRADPVVGRFVFPELDRRQKLRADLAELYGPTWPSRVEVLPATRRYVDRLHEVGRDWPAGFVAHHYTRYLGDLSGGQILARAMQRNYGLTPESLSFYRFELVPKPKLFKDRYRQLLDDVPWDGAEKARVVEESRLAFRLNTGLFVELARVYRPELSA